MSRQYITTAIDYPNAAPHMGHVLEKVLADVCARWFRLRGDKVRFQIGTDEHGIKIQRTAENADKTPKELVDDNVPMFEELYKTLGISYDKFIRTTNQDEHWPSVQELWRRLAVSGKLEKRRYTGLYCSGCERFVTKKDLTDGACAIHKTKPDEVEEENYFFKMSEDSDWLHKLLTEKGGYTIRPDFRANETLSLIEQGLEDVSFSRPKTSLAWGIPVPEDDEHTMYVWCDALTNYISGIGLLTDRAESTWWNDAHVTHVIGKDIARFHALIWPSMLKNADIRTPDTLLIHGFLTSEGEKMSKSLGNVVVPQDVIDKYGVDALRFYLSHEVPVGRDGDFSWKRFEELYNAKLRNQLGNLLNRVLILFTKEEADIIIPESDSDAHQTTEGWKKYVASMDAFEISDAVQQATQLVDVLNGAIDSTKPWTLSGKERAILLSRFLESLRHVSLMLLPFMPEAAQRISMQLHVPYAERMLDENFVITEDMKRWGSQNNWTSVGEPEILFLPIED